MIKTLELFAGAGGLSLGLKKAGFELAHINENNKDCISTLKANHHCENIISDDIRDVEFTHLKGVDFVSGGFPCQAFSHSGKRLGFNDTRGTLFFDFARSVAEIQPKIFLAENVKGLKTHDGGKTLEIIINTMQELGYYVYSPILLNSNDYEVAQNRERIFIFGCLNKYKNKIKFSTPKKQPKINLSDIFLETIYYKNNIDLLNKNGKIIEYSKYKKNFFEKIPEGGNWKNLNVTEQMEYLGKMFYSEGGKTGILKKLSYDKPSPTILTNPSQKQTERCHPKENRPLTVRECARIQSFPDEWVFSGSLASQYKQIGNAVPVNLAYHVGKHIYEQVINL